MKALLLLLCLAVLPGLAGEPPTVTRVALYVQFDQAPPDAVMEAMRSELDTLMAPMGLQFDWRALENNHGDAPSAELAVASFKGRCDASGLPSHSSNPGALGWTHISDGVILPFTDLDCGGLRNFLAEQLQTLPRSEREGILGRALGRVLAHELYHIFANTTHHASDGVGKPTYSVEDLLSVGFRFAKRESQALRLH